MAREMNDKAAVSAELKGVRLTPKLYACRDAARLLLGQQYALRMSELGSALIRTAGAAHSDILQVANDAGRGTDAVSAMQLLAAVVELVEPSA